MQEICPIGPYPAAVLLRGPYVHKAPSKTKNTRPAVVRAKKAFGEGLCNSTQCNTSATRAKEVNVCTLLQMSSETWNLERMCLFFQVIFLHETFIMYKTIPQKEGVYCYKWEMTQEVERM